MITIEDVRYNTPERFWSKISFGLSDECWNWNACKDKDEYGWFRLPRNDRGKHPMIKSHRYMYQMVVSSFDNALHCLHSCDNPSCVNPNHLWVGTHQQNIDDKMKKGRHGHGVIIGSKAKGAKLTEEIVVDIRKRVANGENRYRLAEMTGIKYSTLSNIWNRYTWKHVV